MRSGLVLLLLLGCGNSKSGSHEQGSAPAGSGSASGSAATAGSAGSADPAAAATADRCQRGVTHVTGLMAQASAAKVARPSADEQRVIDSVAEASITTCRQEGLSQEQLDCLLSATDWEAFRVVGDCPALKAKRPGWLR